jgi:hypothetical protein
MSQGTDKTCSSKLFSCLAAVLLTLAVQAEPETWISGAGNATPSAPSIDSYVAGILPLSVAHVVYERPAALDSVLWRDEYGAWDGS